MEWRKANKSAWGLGLALFLAAAGGSGSARADGRKDLMQAAADLRARRYAAAAALLEGVVRAHPASLEAQYYLGQALYYQGRLDAARARFEGLSAAAPDVPVTYYYLGRIAYDRGDDPGAMAQLLRAERLDPELGMVHYYLGLALQREGRSGEALGQLRAARKLQPAFWQAGFAEAYVLFHAFGRRADALAVLRTLPRTRDTGRRRELAALRRAIAAADRRARKAASKPGF